MENKDTQIVPEKKSKLGLVLNIVSIVVAVIAVITMVLVIFTTQAEGQKGKPVFGMRSFIVLSNSMAESDDPNDKTFKANDLIFVKEVTDYSTIKVGDVITYISQEPESLYQVVTHKVLEVKVNNGQYVFVTYGTTNGWETVKGNGELDEAKTEEVEGNNLLYGKKVGQIGSVGTVLNFLRKPVGYAVCVGIPFVAIMVMQAINTIRLVGSYKKIKHDEEFKEKDEENALLKAQLEALRAQMNLGATTVEPLETEQSVNPEQTE